MIYHLRVKILMKKKICYGGLEIYKKYTCLT